MSPDELKALIAQHIDPYHAALLQHAETFVVRQSVNAFPAAVAWQEENRPQPKECYRNAQSFSIHSRAEYYEGYWAKEGRAVHHAWVVVDGEVIDLTAEAGDRLKRKLGISPAVSPGVYCGMLVPTEFILCQMQQTRCWLPVTAAYLTTLGFPVQQPECPTLLPLAAVTATAEVE